jgi:hypothetical protein
MTCTHISEHVARLYDGIIAAHESGVGKRQIEDQRHKTVGGRRKDRTPHEAKQRDERTLGSRARDGGRMPANHGVDPRRRGEQREESRDEWRMDLGVLHILRASGGVGEAGLG